MPDFAMTPRTAHTDDDLDTDLPQLVAAVAEHLPGEWATVSPHPWLVFLTQGDFELGFRLIDGVRPARVRVNRVLPEGAHRVTRLTGKSITASAAHGGAHVAREITRRLLPGYTADIAEAKAALAHQADRLDRCRGSIERVRDLIPGGMWSSNSLEQTTFWGPAGVSFGYRVLSNGACDIDLDRLPELVALEVIALVADRLGLAPATS